MRDRVDDPDPADEVRLGAGQDETPPGVLDESTIRRALAECMTLSDIDDAMSWARGTARKRRWRSPAAGGLPPADAELGGVALWFRTTITRWRTEPLAPTERHGPDAPQPAHTPSEHPPAEHASTAEQRPTAMTPDATTAATERGDHDDDRTTDVSEGTTSTEGVNTGFQLELGQHVRAYVHGAWHPAVVVSRDRRTVVVDYQLGQGPLGARRQRVTIDRVRCTGPAR